MTVGVRAQRVRRAELGADGLVVEVRTGLATHRYDVPYDTIAAVDGGGVVELVDGRALRLAPGDGVLADLAAMRSFSEELGEALVPRSALAARLDAALSKRGLRVSALVRFLLRNTLACGASDLHLEPDHDGAAVRLRVDGFLERIGTVPATLWPRLVTRLKLEAGVPSYVDDRPLEGRITVASPAGPACLRASFVPTTRSCRVVLRAFHPLAATGSLADLGLEAETLAWLEAALARTHGLLVVAGPSSQGKTTTLYSALRAILATRGDRVRVVSIEDPVEYDLPGIDQLEAGRSEAASFAALLASVLRQDVEVIALGEVRDPRSAALAVQAGLTGHLVLTTVHCASAAEARLRLADLGVAERKLDAVLIGTLMQRLVPRLCDACRTPARPSAALCEALGLDPIDPGPCFTGAGCERCDGRGTRGRQALEEVAPAGAPVRSALDTGLAKVRAGTLDPHHLAEALGVRIDAGRG